MPDAFSSAAAVAGGADRPAAPGVDPVRVGLPARTTAVAIGGGVAGIPAVLTLAERGVPVLLCTKGQIAAEQSSRNRGWIRKQGRDVRELSLMLGAQALWRRHAGQLDRDIGHREAGCPHLCPTEAELADREVWMEPARRFRIGARRPSRRELNAHAGPGPGPVSGPGRGWRGAIGAGRGSGGARSPAPGTGPGHVGARETVAAGTMAVCANAAPAGGRST